MVDTKTPSRSNLTSALVRVVVDELHKKENKIRETFVQPALEYVEERVKPYFIVILSLTIVLLLLNVYLTFRFWNTLSTLSIKTTETLS